MRDKKFGTMFDDDEDMTPVSPAASASTEPKAKAPSPVLLNDEARALLDEKARAAGEQAKAAAQKSVAAAGRAASVVRERVSKLRASTAGVSFKLPWVRIASVLLVVSVLGGAIAWLVLSKDPDNAEPSPAVVPIIPLPSAAPVVPAALEPPAPQASKTPVLDAPLVDAVPEALVMPVMGPAPGRYVPPASEPGPAPAPETTVDVAPVVSPLEISAQPAGMQAPVLRSATATTAPIKPSTPPVVKADRPRAAAPKQAPAPQPAPVGQREQQQIDQIKSLFGEEN